MPVLLSCLAVMLYTAIGYPLIVALAARSAPNEPDTSDYMPSVSLVIAAHNEAEVIGEKLRNTTELDYPAELLQVIVVDDGSDDSTTEIASTYARHGVEVIRLPERAGKSQALNAGVEHAHNDIVVFSDANNRYAPDAVRRLAARFDNPDVGAVTGAKYFDTDTTAGLGERLYWGYESFMWRQESRLGCCTNVAGEVLAVRKLLYEPLTPGLVNDDFYLAMHVLKSGSRVVFEPEARSYEHAIASIGDEAIRRERMAAGVWQILIVHRGLIPWSRPVVAWQVISHKYLRLVLPFAMIGALASNAYAALSPRRAFGARRTRRALRILLAGQLAAYLAPEAAARLRTPAIVTRLLAPVGYVVHSNLAVAFGLRRFLGARHELHLWTKGLRDSDGNGGG